MKHRNWNKLYIAVISGIALATFNVGVASDHEADPDEWVLSVGLNGDAHGKDVDLLKGKGMQVVDYEIYRYNRDTVHSSVWIKKRPGREWAFEKELSYRDFNEKNDGYLKAGFSILDIEIGRIGAGLLFSGVWVKGLGVEKSHLSFSMDELLFSNRYGEMADQGYRLVDFEAYQANGRSMYAGIWIRNEGVDPRFYRGLGKNEFLNVSAKLNAAGYRVIDVESYDTEEGQRFAAQWVRKFKNQDSRFAFDLMPDEFYQKNSSYQDSGFRLVDFEVFTEGNIPRYAGSWVKEEATDEKVKEQAKESFLEVLRRGDAAMENE